METITLPSHSCVPIPVSNICLESDWFLAGEGDRTGDAKPPAWRELSHLLAELGLGAPGEERIRERDIGSPWPMGAQWQTLRHRSSGA